MPEAIIYKQDDGKVAIIYPTPEAIYYHGIDAVARKDVPAGKPFKIIEHGRYSDIPTDRTFREAWTVDEADLTDGVGSEFSTFEEVLS